MFRLRWLLIAVQALMLNVVLPGHTRGQMTVSGWKSAPSCCGENHPHQPTDAERARCAVCYFAAGLALPPPVISAPTLLGAARETLRERPDAQMSVAVELPRSARGPPSGIDPQAFSRGL